jgi:hypothetical protein
MLAQTDALPFAVGETVTLWLEQGTPQPSMGSTVECAVAEIRGGYVKCGPRNRIGGTSTQTERWLALRYVVQVTKRMD